MGRSPCCVKEGLNRGAWTAIEDKILKEYIKVHGEGRWRNLPKRAGLKRCGKSCRLRWLNYLRPDIKRGNITPDEEELIIRLHKLLGNRWSLIAGRLPGRTDNEIKNYWNTILSKKVKQKEENNTGSPSSSNSKKWDTSNNVIRTKATKCSRVYFDPHLQPYHMDVAFEPPNDVFDGELSLSTSYENLGFMLEAHQDLEMGLSAGTQETCNFSEFLNSDFSDMFHVYNGDKKVNNGLLPSTSSSIQQSPLISDELALAEDWNVQSLPFRTVLGDWLVE